MAKSLIDLMNVKYKEMGKLPESIVIRSDADESHLKELNIIK